MTKHNIPKQERLPLTETVIRNGAQKLELLAGCLVGAVIGAVEGAKGGIAAMHERHIERGVETREIEQFANSHTPHDQ